MSLTDEIKLKLTLPGPIRMETMKRCISFDLSGECLGRLLFRLLGAQLQSHSDFQCLQSINSFDDSRSFGRSQQDLHHPGQFWKKLEFQWTCVFGADE